jgi:hypothetical protein
MKECGLRTSLHECIPAPRHSAGIARQQALDLHGTVVVRQQPQLNTRAALPWEEDLVHPAPL